MIGNILYLLDDNQKKTIAKYATVFVGGVAVGFVMKQFLDSSVLDNVKKDDDGIVEDYLNNKTDEDKEEFIDIQIDE